MRSKRSEAPLSRALTALQLPHERDLDEGRVGGERLSLAGRLEAEPAVERLCGPRAVADRELEPVRASLLRPRRDRVGERLAEAAPARAGVDPHTPETGRAGLVLAQVAAG